MIVFAYTKFGIVRIQGSGVKRGEAESAPRSERVFQIPVQIGLKLIYWGNLLPCVTEYSKQLQSG